MLYLSLMFLNSKKQGSIQPNKIYFSLGKWFKLYHFVIIVSLNLLDDWPLLYLCRNSVCDCIRFISFLCFCYRRPCWGRQVFISLFGKSFIAPWLTWGECFSFIGEHLLLTEKIRLNKSKKLSRIYLMVS